MNISKRLLIILIIAGTCIGCDQVSKGVARARLEGMSSVTYAGNVVRFEYQENAGVLMGIGSDLPGDFRFWFFIVLIGFFLALVLAYVLLGRGIETGDMYAAALILGGGFSNLLDRMFYGGSVIDFLTIGVGYLRTAVFNFADVMIIAGVAVFAVRLVVRRGKHEPAP